MKCVVHIGTEKTGTTLLQEWLYSNKKELSRQGVGLTQKAEIPNNRKLVAYFQNSLDPYLQKHQISTEAQRRRFFAGFEEEMRQELSSLAADHDCILITSEFFHSRYRSVDEIAKLKNFLSSIFDEIKIVGYFREQSRVRTSLYSTLLKMNYDQPLDNFQTTIDEKWHYYNYFELVSKWESVFGRDNLIIRLYERDALLDADIRKDFIVQAVPDIDLDQLNFDVSSANESLSIGQAYFTRILNAAVGGALNGTLKNEILQLDSLRGANLVDCRQAEIYDRFDASNRKFFARYFGTEENLFKRPSPPLPANENEKVLARDVVTPDIVSEVITAMLTAPGVALIRKHEKILLRDTAIRLFRAGHITVGEAITLLRLAERADQADELVKSTLAELTRLVKSAPAGGQPSDAAT